MDGEFRMMLGGRQQDDDGFTYVSGAHKAGRKKRTRWKNVVARCTRNDKRGAKAAAFKRELREAVM